jgi:DNA repair protein RadC
MKSDQEMPRERLIAEGARNLSDRELLAILLKTGTRGRDVFALSDEVLAIIDQKNLSLHVADIASITGIGNAKACTIVAALEFSRRRIASDGTKIKQPEDVLPLVQHLADRKQETVVCLSLNGAHEVIATRVVTVGLVNLCQIHPREVFADPLTDRACAVIVAHNHPSGDLTPSKEDLDVTARLKDAAQILGLRFLDHIVFSKRGYYSILQGAI